MIQALFCVCLSGSIPACSGITGKIEAILPILHALKLQSYERKPIYTNLKIGESESMIAWGWNLCGRFV